MKKIIWYSLVITILLLCTIGLLAVFNILPNTKVINDKIFYASLIVIIFLNFIFNKLEKNNKI